MAGGIDYGDDGSCDWCWDGSASCASGDATNEGLRPIDRRQARHESVSATGDLVDAERGNLEAMMRPPSPTTAQGSEPLRRRRVDLHESMSAVGQALAQPADGQSDMWAERVRVALVELSTDFGEHLHVSQGTEGLYPRVLAVAPRLSNAVDDLIRERMRIMALVDTLLANTRGARATPETSYLHQVG
jgi:hypothetical protein